MRRLTPVLLLAILAACSSGLPEAPRNLRLGYDGKGTLSLQVPQGTVWELGAGKLKVEPARGIGPAVINFRAEPGQAPTGAQGNFTLPWMGDLQGNLTITWPLVRVEGRVVERTPSGTGFQFPAVPLDRNDGYEPAQKTGRVLVRYRNPAAAPQNSFVAGSRTLRLLETSDVKGLLARLRNDPNVIWAEPDGIVYALGEPADEFYPLQWHLRRTGARWAHLGSYTRDITVAVIDTGVRFDHPDLAGRLWGPADGAFDFVDSDNDPTDPGDLRHPKSGSHGTHVTGIIAARTGVNTLPPGCYDKDKKPVCSKTGVVGLAWPASVKVMPLRVLDKNGRGTFSAVSAAIRYAAGIPIEWGGKKLTNPHPARIINLSLGTTIINNSMCAAVTDAAAAGVQVVAAAGNAGGTLYYFPASCKNAISVAAVDNYPGDPKPTWYSQHNDRITLSAPGGDVHQDADEDGYPDGILSTTWNFKEGLPNFAFYMGTSQASPQVAAALALLLAQDPNRSAKEARDLLVSSASDLGPDGYDEYYGYGILNMPGALGLKLPPGPYRVRFEGPIERWARADVNGNFWLYLPSGNYEVSACRDDSANLFCDRGEPRTPRTPYRVEARPRVRLPLLTIP